MKNKNNKGSFKQDQQEDAELGTTDSANEISFEKYVALTTIKVTCNGIFELVEGQEIPKEISKPFIESLVSTNLIKLIK